MTKVNTSYSAMAPTIRRRWKEAQLIPNRIAVADKKVDQILEPAARARYELIERETGVPWPLIAVKHMREANNNFKGVLHNGQAIVGTGRLTTIVPVNMGPFATWEDSARHALAYMGLTKIKSWPIERVLYEAERFNGMGYAQMGLPSPYVWSGTNQYVKGKYVSDGKFDPDHVDTQLGVALVLKRMEARGVELLRGQAEPTPAPVVVPAPVPAQPVNPDTAPVLDPVQVYVNRVKSVQKHLFRVGLKPGDVDGDIGPNTIGAMATFRTAFGLQGVANQIDPELEKALETTPTDYFKPAPERAAATPEQAAAKSETVEQVVQGSWIRRKITDIAAALGLGGYIDSQTDILGLFSGKWSTITSKLAMVPWYVWAIVILVGYILYREYLDKKKTDAVVVKAFQKNDIIGGDRHVPAPPPTAN